MNPDFKDLPCGWKWETLGNIAEVVGGGTPSTRNAANFGGNIPWLTPADLSGYTSKFISHGERFISEHGFKTSSAKMMPAGTVLFTSRAPIGYVAIASTSICTNQGFKSFVLKEGVLPDYLYWWLKGNKELAESFASGTTFLELSGTKAKQLPIPIPPTTEEQEQIVAEIEKQFSRLDEAVAALKRIQANLKRYKAAVLKTAIEGKLTEKWRKEHPDVEPADQLLKRILAERRAKWEAVELAKMKAKGIKPKDDSWKKKYKEPAGPDTANLPELPEGWVWATLDAMAFVTKLAGFEYTKFVKYDPDGDLAVIKAENAGKNGFKRTEFSRINSSTVVHLTRSKVKAGDLLMVFVGAGTGNVARVPDDQEFFLGPNISMIRIESTLLLSAYLELFLRSSLGSALTLGFMKAVAQPSISMGTIRQISIIIPPIKEQKIILEEIDRRLSVTEELEVTIGTNLKRAERLRQRILQQAFAGDLV